MKYEINKKANGPLYVTEEDLIKQNANCPASEKTGSGPGSCGGSKDTSRSKSVRDVTKTNINPEYPSWLKEKLTKNEPLNSQEMTYKKRFDKEEPKKSSKAILKEKDQLIKIPSKVLKSGNASGTRMAKDVVDRVTGTNDDINDIATPDNIEEAMHSDFMDLVNHGKMSGDKATEKEYKNAWANSFKLVIEKYKAKKK